MGTLDKYVTEEVLMATITEAARLYGWLVYHTHDSRRSAAGFPDLVLVRPPQVIFAELKRQAGRRPGRAQAQWLAALACCSVVEAKLWRPSDLDTIMQILGAKKEVQLGADYR